MTTRTLQRVIPSIPASDGAGVKLRRSLGASQLARHDPFLMLDEFYSDNPDDYLAGFPSHPHRGFDSGGNTGDLGPGDVQWMTAARGLIHSEMPQQTEGRMRGFQLWLNLPAKEKMKAPAYQDIPAKDIPVVRVAGGEVKVIAGRFGDTTGAVHGGSTDPQYWDVHLEPDAAFAATLPAGHNAFLYAYEGEATVGEDAKALPHRAAGLLGEGDTVRITAGAKGARVLVLAGKPLREPVVQYGPFVMNTREEIEQALADYQSGAFARDQVRRIKVAMAG
jgi:redox-sensitive bicupin YhaK (pirin superfamily)